MDLSFPQHQSRQPPHPSTNPSAAEESFSIDPRRKYKRRATDTTIENKDLSLENDSGSFMSDSEEHELGPIDSHGDVDEESGLTGEDRQKHIQRKRRRDALDARIAGAGGDGISKDEAREADRNVVKNLTFNAALIALWYLFSLSISIYNKWMFSSDHLDFHFPLFTTALHMAVQFLLSSIVLLIFPRLRPSQPSLPSGLSSAKPLVTPLFYLTRLVPTGTTTSLDIGLGNTSLRFITLTFYTMCKSSVLIFVLTFAFLFRLETPSLKLILIILTMTGGVLMMVAGETAFNPLGFTLAMSASFFSGFRWALTQILLLRHPATSNPFATLFFLAPIMFVTLFVIALVSETPSAVIAGLHLLSHQYGIVKTLLLLFIPGCLAFCMIAAEFTLLQRTSVVTLSICGIFKEVVTISAAGIVFHDELSAVNVSGLLVTIVCIACYNYLKVTQMRQDARDKLAGISTDGDDDNAKGVETESGGDEDAVPLIRGQGGDIREEDEDDDTSTPRNDLGGGSRIGPSVSQSSGDVR